MSTQTDTVGRRSRMHASSTGKRVSLQERDWLWLQKIHRHGPLPSSFLLQFAQRLGRSKKRAIERLGDLFHEDGTKHNGPYLTRPTQQFQTVDSRYNQLVHELAPAGMRALKEEGMWNDQSGPNGGPWWHRLLVSSITASIELGARDRRDVSFIPQSKILDRANATLSFEVLHIDPTTGARVAKRLRPDAVFGLEYHTPLGSRFRFFAVEADRGTEPLTTSNANRKSIGRSLAQYVAFIGEGAYKSHLNLTAPLLLLHVTNSRARMQSMLRLQMEVNPRCNYMLFTHWQAFSSPNRIPTVNTGLLDQHWLRGGSAPLKIV